MSILDDFLTNDLAHLPNDTQNVPASAPQCGKRAQQHAHAKPIAHSAEHEQPNAYQNAQNCLPCRQKNAADFLAGNTPGVMAFYAPEEQLAKKQRFDGHPSPQPANIQANTRADNATIEDAETVQRLIEWREEASY